MDSDDAPELPPPPPPLPSLPQTPAGGDGDVEVVVGAAEDDYEEEEEGAEEMTVCSTDEDDEYDLVNYGIAQALPVPDGPPPDLSAGPPQTAEEYLAWVRHEAQQRPNVTRAKIDPAKLAAAAAAAGPGPGSSAAAARSAAAGLYLRTAPGAEDQPCQEWAKPSAKWVMSFLQDFAQLRRRLQHMQATHAAELAQTRLPHMEDSQAWFQLCFGQWQGIDQHHDQDGTEPAANGSGAAPPVAAAAHHSETDRILGPVLRTVLALDQLGVSTLLQRQVEELVGSQQQQQPGAAAAAALSYMRSQWLFALSAVLQKPVPPELSASYRSLVRACAGWRAALTVPEDPVLPRVNVLMAIAGGYFGQDEHMSRLMAAAGDLP